MITKAIILERNINTNTYSVRVPFLESSGIAYGKMDATISCNPGITEEYKPGDVVYVNFEDHKPDKVVIVGKLYVESLEPRGSANFEALNVSKSVSLPKNTTVDGKSLPDLLNKVQNLEESTVQPYTPFAIVIDATTNINGWQLTNFTASLDTIEIGSHYYTCYVIEEEGNPLTEIRALDYMEAMTGIRYVPKYNFHKPKNTYLIFADGSIWKAQYDKDNGLLLFAMPNPLA